MAWVQYVRNMMGSVWVLMSIAYVLAVARICSGSDNPRLDGWFRACQERARASDEDYQLIKMRKIPQTNEGVCMVECLFNKLHIIEDGQFNRRGFVITFSPVVKGDLRKLAGLKKIASTCDKEISKVASKSGCDTTKMVLDCFARNKNELDLTRRP